jgi:hybrid cluster-associated redox disulfide protein
MDTVFYGAVGLSILLSLVNWRRCARLKREIERLDRGTDELRAFVNVSHERMKSEILSRVQTELRRREGGPAFHRDMSVGEAMKLHPQAAAVMAGFHLGGCSSCSISDNHILGDAARDYGVNIDRLLTALNGLFDGTTKPPEDGPHAHAGQMLQIQAVK